jgi:sugar (pentulose or hexulose) kinase
MTDKYLMALDAGSGSGRCVVVSLDGRKFFATKKEWFYFTPPGLASSANEFHPDEFWRIFADCIRETLAKAGIRGEDVLAVSSTSQREGLVALDKDGMELYAGPNRDFRAAMEGIFVTNNFGEEIYRRSGHYPSGLFGIARLLWFKKNQPELFARFATVLSMNDWVLFRVSGVRSSEPTNASETAMYDIQKHEWMKDIVDKLGLPDLLPPVHNAGTVIGGVTEAVAKETGLKAGTPVVAGAADTQCGLLGCGLLNTDDTGIISGTTTPVQTITDTVILDPQIRTWADPYVIPGKYVLESNSGGSGSVFQWLRDTISESEVMRTSPEQAYAEMVKIAEKAPPGSNGVLIHSGVNIFNAKKIGMPVNVFLLGLSPLTGEASSGKGLIIRAMLENFVYGAKANFDQVVEVLGRQPSVIGVCGGLSKSDLYNQIMADVLALPVKVPFCREGSGVGCAICAGIGAGQFKDFSEGVQAMVHLDRVYEPDAQNVGKYKNYYRRWLKSFLTYLQ